MTATSTRALDALFARYEMSHRHPANKAIHWVCVPAIMWSVLALLWSVSPIAAYALAAFAMAFYVWLSRMIAAGMLIVVALILYSLARFGAPALPLSISVFVAAWIGQVVGHRIEGRKPAFVDDVKFLLVGPAWLLASFYRAVDIRY